MTYLIYDLSVICHKPADAFISLLKVELSEILNQWYPDIKVQIPDTGELKDHRRCSCHKNCIIIPYLINRDTLESDFDLVFTADFKNVFTCNAVKYFVVRSGRQNISVQKKDI